MRPSPCRERPRADLSLDLGLYAVGEPPPRRCGRFSNRGRKGSNVGARELTHDAELETHDRDPRTSPQSLVGFCPSSSRAAARPEGLEVMSSGSPR
jgi:hypothetical protein